MPTTSPRAAVSGPQSQRKRPGDLTGVNGQKLAKARDEAQEEALAAAATAKQDDRVERLSTVVDYSEGGIEQRGQYTQNPGVAEVHPTTMTVRVNYPIEEMTFGRRVLEDAEFDAEGLMTKPPVLGGLETYNFDEGVQYKVPYELGAHLKEKGYVYDF